MKAIYLVTTILFLAFVSCQSQSVQTSIDVSTFNTKMTTLKNAIVLDVRTPEEYTNGYIGKALNIDYESDAFEKEISKLDKSKTYLLYCESGGRSKSALEVMHEQGFKNVFELNGGMEEWVNSKLPVSTKPD